MNLLSKILLFFVDFFPKREIKNLDGCIYDKNEMIYQSILNA